MFNNDINKIKYSTIYLQPDKQSDIEKSDIPIRIKARCNGVTEISKDVVVLDRTDESGSGITFPGSEYWPYVYKYEFTDKFFGVFISKLNTDIKIYLEPIYG